MIITVPMPKPHPVLIDSSTVEIGLPITPLARLRMFSPNEWEDFVLEWADSLHSDNQTVESCAGAGDMGRDVIVTTFYDDGTKDWDNYQCKHYNHSLHPSDIWLELGKLVYYTYIKEFTFPRRYYFVAPQGVGTKLIKLFGNANELRKQLIQNWESYCTLKITTKKKVPLDGNLLKYINKLDFAIVGYIKPTDLITQHSKTRYHIARFGGGLPVRPDASLPPDSPAPKEVVYLSKLMDAYGDHLKRGVKDLSDIEDEQSLYNHCTRSRKQFYSAESLRAFSRDYLPEGEFRKLQDEFYEGIQDELDEDHPSGYKRVCSVVKVARSLQISNHPLSSKLGQLDRAGICHQLANDKDEVQWVIKK